MASHPWLKADGDLFHYLSRRVRFFDSVATGRGVTSLAAKNFGSPWLAESAGLAWIAHG
jgi:hypothetical protein